MIYTEELRNGVLCRRETPDGEWEELSRASLTGLLMYERERTRLLAHELLNSRGENENG